MGKFVDLTGRQYYYLTVLEKTNRRKGGSVVWKCQCKCGNITYASSSALNSSHTKSCGCYDLELKTKRGRECVHDLTGKRYGELIVLKRVENKTKSDGESFVCWECQCSCGNTAIVAAYSLTSGHTQTCGKCKQGSHGEIKIKQLLNNNNIEYEIEKNFEGCCSEAVTKNKYRFDFYVNKTYCIEFDGRQHYVENGSGWGESLTAIQKRDTYKTNYCKEHNIPLIRIPYTHYNDLCIEDLMLETTTFRVV